ncbi:MAG: L-aspartate oxidase [Candidatus Latescibacterota bacterium]|nr:MAG: L-aspartate oxidase [Candidatus Latescibacterota bacterium]
MNKSDFLVIGSGIAGLFFALKAAQTGTVAVVTKRGASDSSTSLAQGGIASVLDPKDSFDLHIEDTLKAGVGLCRRDIVEMVVKEGPGCVKELMDFGVEFSKEGDRLALGREGGHSANRIVHYHDLTGQEMQRILLRCALEHPNVTMCQNHMAVGLICRRHLRRKGSDGDRAVYGAYVLDTENDRIEAFASKRTILATGGAGKVYLYSSNPDVATGDGIAIAHRAGARVANLEFVQFHPTWLYHPIYKSFLLTEALRGEGGTLVRADGHAFMKGYHPQGDLAPRDIVARAIDKEMKRTGEKCVYLDMTHLSSEHLQDRFPYIYRSCKDVGIDMAVEPIPVVPATHYFCGGVDVDSYGRASLPNLFALGEVSHTGLHGANRLASNSLLEAVVYARRAAALLAEDEGLSKETIEDPLPWDEKHTELLLDSVIVDHDWDMSRRVMWDYVGIVRSDRRLQIALARMKQLKETVEALYWKCHLTLDLLELRNIVLIGELIIRSALQRKESRGLHYTESYPERNDKEFLRDTVLESGHE